jgi:hypothetical protein
LKTSCVPHYSDIRSVWFNETFIVPVLYM